MTVRPRRSVLYMPASNQKAIDKARTLPCDAVILDLEDAVAPEAKDMARAQAVEAVKAGGFGRREIIIRVNSLDTPWGAADLAAAAHAGPDAVLVPKINDGADVARYNARLDAAPAHTARTSTPSLNAPTPLRLSSKIGNEIADRALSSSPAVSSVTSP